MHFLYTLLTLLSCSLVVFLIMWISISDKRTFIKILKRTLIQIPCSIIKRESIPWLMHIILTIFVWIPAMSIYPLSPVILAFILYCSTKQEGKDEDESN